jgi:hypothetical protein
MHKWPSRRLMSAAAAAALGSVCLACQGVQTTIRNAAPTFTSARSASSAFASLAAAAASASMRARVSCSWCRSCCSCASRRRASDSAAWQTDRSDALQARNRHPSQLKARAHGGIEGGREAAGAQRHDTGREERNACAAMLLRPNASGALHYKN